MSNKKLGNDFETELCEILFQNGFWVHNMAQNKSGQPADVIAVRNKQAYLIDCKVCSDDRFKLDRIESNQHMSMDLWRDSGNDEGLFAVKFQNEIYIVGHSVFKELDEIVSSFGVETFPSIGVTLSEWIRLCN